MKKFYLLGSIFTISLVIFCLVINAAIDLPLSGYLRHFDYSYLIILLSSAVSVFLLFGFLMFYYEYNYKQYKNQLILSSVSLFIIGFSSVYFISNHSELYSNYKEYITLNAFSNLPETTDVIEAKSLIMNGRYDELSALPKINFIYIDSLSLSIAIKTYNNKELNEYFNKFINDGYISLTERDLIYKEMNDLMIAQLRQ